MAKILKKLRIKWNFELTVPDLYHKFLKNYLALPTCAGYQFITIVHTTGQLEKFYDGHFCFSDIFGNKAAKFRTTVVYNKRRKYPKGQKGLVIL